jgi:hypothetical protein
MRKDSKPLAIFKRALTKILFDKELPALAEEYILDKGISR